MYWKSDNVIVLEFLAGQPVIGAIACLSHLDVKDFLNLVVHPRLITINVVSEVPGMASPIEPAGKALRIQRVELNRRGALLWGFNGLAGGRWQVRCGFYPSAADAGEFFAVRRENSRLHAKARIGLTVALRTWVPVEPAECSDRASHHGVVAVSHLARAILRSGGAREWMLRLR
jgi:hypothetical protein